MGVCGGKALLLVTAGLGAALHGNPVQAQAIPIACLYQPMQPGEPDPDLRDPTVRYDPAPDNHELTINTCFASNMNLVEATVAYAAFDAQGHLVGGTTPSAPIGSGPLSPSAPDPKIISRFEGYVALDVKFDGATTKWVLADVAWTPVGGCPSGQLCTTRFLFDVSGIVALQAHHPRRHAPPAKSER